MTIAKARPNDYERQLSYLKDWIDRHPEIQSILARLERSEPSLDPEIWLDDQPGRGSYSLPGTEEGLAKVAWHVVKIAAADDLTRDQLMVFSRASSFEEMFDALTGILVEPLFDYIDEQLSSASDMLYLLGRYRHQVMWFDHDALYEAFEEDTKHGEAVYDRHLRRFLFESGIDFPFSEPSGPSGKADVVADLDTDDPLTCEVKLFDGTGRSVGYLAQGVTQARKYAEDYGQSTAFLVIINLTEESLNLPSDGDPDSWPPRLHVGDVTVFLIVVPARRVLAASKSGKTVSKRVTRSELVEDDSG